jgi:hypothetical protein
MVSHLFWHGALQPVLCHVIVPAESEAHLVTLL